MTTAKSLRITRASAKAFAKAKKPVRIAQEEDEDRRSPADSHDSAMEEVARLAERMNESVSTEKDTILVTLFELIRCSQRKSMRPRGGSWSPNS